MTNDFSILISFLRYPICGIIDDSIEEYDADIICQMAVKQGVFPMVYASMTRDGRQLSPQWETSFLATVMKNERKLSFLAILADEFKKNGIDCCVLKGCTIAALYHIPECRISGDIDILIQPDKEKRAISVLEGLGMKIKERNEGSQHFVAVNDIAGLIEVHVCLYSKTFNEIVLRNKFKTEEPYIELKINDYLTVDKLGVLDDLYFLTAHLIKHFIKEGCGIRQVTDLLVYIDKNRDSIEFKAYFAVLYELGFGKLIKNVLGIGVKYFDMSFEEYETDLIEEILTDIEDGGNFGFGEAERKGFYEKFLSYRTNLKNDEFTSMMDARKKKSILKSVFLPSKRFLINKGYRYLEKSVLLYPIAYVQRIGGIVLKLINKERSINKDFSFSINDNDKLKERAVLMEQLELI